MDHDLEHRIRERAYEIWQEEGRPEGREAQHWQQAAAEFAEARQESSVAAPRQVTRKGSLKTPTSDASAKRAKASSKPAALSGKSRSSAGGKARGGKSKGGK